MEHVKFIEIKKGVDVGYHNSAIEPVDREGCVGVRGIDKSYTIYTVLQLAYKIDNKPNIIVKSGPNGKWYLKRFEKDTIDEEIEKQKWRDTSRCTMFIIDWDE
jgi:hypothetical protein